MAVDEIRLLTERQVAEIFGISVARLQRDRLLGAGIQHYKLGSGLRSGVRYRAADVEAWLAANRRGPVIPEQARGEAQGGR